MSQTTIRNIHKPDKPAIHQLIEALNQADHLSLSLTDEWFDHVLSEAGDDIFVALIQDQIIGLATCMINPMDKDQAAVSILVHPDYRSKGIGQGLYDQILDHAQKKQIYQLEVYVKERLESAVQFAKNRGFQPVLFSWQMELELDREAPHQQEVEDITFRIATKKDGMAYAAIINQCFGDDLQSNALEQLYQDPSIQVYFIEKHQKIIGTTTMQQRPNLSLGYIYDVAVLAQYRGQGLGSQMLKLCIRKLKTNHIQKASLLVTGENKSASALYHKLGFIEVDKDVIMQKRIKKY